MASVAQGDVQRRVAARCELRMAARVVPAGNPIRGRTLLRRDEGAARLEGAEPEGVGGVRSCGRWPYRAEVLGEPLYRSRGQRRSRSRQPDLGRHRLAYV